MDGSTRNQENSGQRTNPHHIRPLEGQGRLGQLSAVDQSVARARKEAPEASFSELSATLGLSRARVQRAFARIESAAAASLPAGD